MRSNNRITRWAIAAGLLLSFDAAAGDLTPQQNAKGKWGYVDESGAVVIDYKYDEARSFSNGVAIVAKKELLGVVGEDGRELLPTKYNIIDNYGERIYRVAIGGKYRDGVLSGEKYGFIDTSGNILLKPEYDEVGAFNGGVAYVKKGSLYGYIDETMQFVAPCRYSSVGAFNANGHAWVCLGGKYGIIDKTGKVIVPAKFKTVGVFVRYVYTPKSEYLEKLNYTLRRLELESGSHCLHARQALNTMPFSKLDENAVGYFMSDKDGIAKNGVYSLDGQLLVPAGKYNNAFYPGEGLALVNLKGKYNYHNVATGKLQFKKPFYNAWTFEDGSAVVEFDSQSGMCLIDVNGNAISKTYNKIYPRREGLHIVVSAAGTSGAIDHTGKEVLPATQFRLLPPSDGYMLCIPKASGKAGYVGTDGKWIIKPTYEMGTSFFNGLADVKTAEGWGLIDQKGKQVVACRWANTVTRKECAGDYMWVTDESGDNPGWMLLKISSDSTVSGKYKWLRHVNQDFPGVALAGNGDDSVGVIDTDGNLIIPTEFTSALAAEAYRMLLASGKSRWGQFDTYRLKLYNNPDRNKGLISDKIESSMWDY